MASKHDPYWSTSMAYDLGRDQNEFIVSNTKRPPYQLITVYFRGMEKTYAETKIKGGTPNIQYELSLLSDGVKCATQGCKYCYDFYIIFFPQIDKKENSKFCITLML